MPPIIARGRVSHRPPKRRALHPSADEIEAVSDAEITLKNGNKAHVTMHLIEGGEDQIRKQLMQSLDAFFEFYPEL